MTRFRTRRIPALLGMPLCAAVAVLASPRAAQAQVDYHLSGVAQGGVVGTDRPAAGDAHWDAVGAYAVTGSLETVTDSGVTYGALLRVGSGNTGRSTDRPGNADRQGIGIDQAYVYAAGGWGKVRLGQSWGASERATDLLPLLVGGEMDGFWTQSGRVRPPGTALGRAYAARDSDDATKVDYETPRLFGVKAGFSYAPERRAFGQDIVAASVVPAETNFWEGAVNYRGDWGPVQYELGAAYNHADAAHGWLRDTSTVTLAGGLTYGGFTVGTVLFDDGDSGLLRNRTAAAHGDAPGDTRGATVQGTYENGPYGLTLFWHGSETENWTTYQAYGLGLSWKVRGDTTLGLDLIHWAADLESGNPAAMAGQSSPHPTGNVATAVVEFRF
ncbi:porin [Nitrospirillum sp. BR 11828]|uniref:porin n=1 Tax=Nitrospirillum sp. BR 11828 TaxID=3104325 RepID=UPI002ACA1863|nr:porin [Nitrospirillum sp. BR 11828]MDZ5646764.1 porin [Nitrospirillum sp. BR 11828]